MGFVLPWDVLSSLPASACRNFSVRLWSFVAYRWSQKTRKIESLGTVGICPAIAVACRSSSGKGIGEERTLCCRLSDRDSAGSENSPASRNQATVRDFFAANPFDRSHRFAVDRDLGEDFAETSVPVAQQGRGGSSVDPDFHSSDRNSREEIFPEKKRRMVLFPAL